MLTMRRPSADNERTTMQQQLGRSDDGPPADDPTFDRRRGPRRVEDDTTPLDRREAERRALPGIERLLEDVEKAAPGETDASASAIPFDRRQGPRRAVQADAAVPADRRGPDRRRRKPGLAALFGAILGLRPGAAPDEG
jgi:hypothetical protein